MNIKHKVMLEIILPFFKRLYDINFYDRVMYERDIMGDLCINIIMLNSDIHTFQLKIINEMLNSMTALQVIEYIDPLIEICVNGKIEPSYKGFTVFVFKNIKWELEFSEELAKIIYLAGD